MQSIKERLERWLSEEGLEVVVYDDPQLELSMGVLHTSGVQFTIVQEKGRADKITLYLSMSMPQHMYQLFEVERSTEPVGTLRMELCSRFPECVYMSEVDEGGNMRFAAGYELYEDGLTKTEFMRCFTRLLNMAVFIHEYAATKLSGEERETPSGMRRGYV